MNVSKDIKKNGRFFHVSLKYYISPSEFGIDGGRVSKLWISEKTDSGRVMIRCNYDRGWDLPPDISDSTLKAVYKSIIDRYN